MGYTAYKGGPGRLLAGPRAPAIDDFVRRAYLMRVGRPDVEPASTSTAR